jgi:glycosyltransferase involved in cell wall biosynthesis
MRKGQNPAKMGMPAYQPKRLGVAILVYIPSLYGYFEQLLSILKNQVASLYSATPGDFDLMVFDNGSCPAVQEELMEMYQSGAVEWLVCSEHNLGKTGALNWILGAMPNELICYSDSDVLFRPGWLENSLKILETFPRPGVVAAQPSFFDQLQGEGTAHRALENDPRFSLEKVNLDSRVVDEYIQGIGLPEAQAESLRATPVTQVTDWESGTQAVLGATHMQFIIPREVARQVLPLPATRGLSGEEDRSFDWTIDQAGFLHLSTPVPYVYHMGNVYDEITRQELQRMPRPDFLDGSQAEATKSLRPHRRAVKLLKSVSHLPGVDHTLRQLYSILFEYHSS